MPAANVYLQALGLHPFSVRHPSQPRPLRVAILATPKQSSLMASPTSSVGFQVSLELSRIKPLRDVASSAYHNLVDYARRARLSGSDIVVEEDLTTLFGRMRVSTELEEQYRDVVKIQRFTPLYKGCEIRLDAGAGPTVQNALKSRAYMVTVIQLSMLTYFHGRSLLSKLLSRAITKRFESRIANALPDPGEEGIAKVIEAVSSQTCAFGWHIYSQMVEDRLRSSIPHFQYQAEYSRLSSAVILGSLDFLYITQSLPDDRRLTLTTEAGCIPFIVWAHYILEFTVILSGEFGDVIFGDTNDARPCASIQWTGISSVQVREASIKLHERDMAVILEIAPEEELRSVIIAEERHPILGYGTTSLKRSLNTIMITPETEPVYEDSVKMIISMAIRISKRIFWEGKIYEKRKWEGIEIWRMLKVGQMLFSGLPVSLEEVRNYVDYSGQDEPGKNLLPPVFNSCLERAEKVGVSAESYTASVLRQFLHQANVIIALSFVINIEDCVSMPIIMARGGSYGSWFSEINDKFEDLGSKINLKTIKMPQNITMLLTSARGGNHDSWDRLVTDGYPFLWSDFGWSIFLDIVGDKDPSEVQLGFVYIKAGVPTRQGTNERRPLLVDGNARPFGDPPTTFPVLRGDRYIPRAAASITNRQEFWAVRPDCFELSVIHSVEPTSESLQHSETWKPFEMSTKYAELTTTLHNTPTTPPCKHASSLNKFDRLLDLRSERLGPDAAVIVGWSHRGTAAGISERVSIALTKGVSALRWKAIQEFHTLSGYHTGILVTNDCCEEYALTLVSSMPGRKTLIL